MKLGFAIFVFHLVSAFASDQNDNNPRTSMEHPPRKRSSPSDLFYNLQLLQWHLPRNSERHSPPMMLGNVLPPNIGSVSNQLPLKSRKKAIEHKDGNHNMASDGDYEENVAQISNDPDIVLEKQYFLLKTLPDESPDFTTGRQKQDQPQQLRVPSPSAKRENGIQYNLLRNTDTVLNLHPNFVTPLELDTKNIVEMPNIKGQTSGNVSSDFSDGSTQIDPRAERQTGFENKDAVIADRSGNSFYGQNSESKNSHHRGTRSVDSSGMPSHICHSVNLHKCGTRVINKFAPDEKSASKCKIREKFLDCMVKERKKGCQPTDEFKYSPDDTNSTRSEIKKFLHSAHGCLLF